MGGRRDEPSVLPSGEHRLRERACADGLLILEQVSYVNSVVYSQRTCVCMAPPSLSLPWRSLKTREISSLETPVRRTGHGKYSRRRRAPGNTRQLVSMHRLPSYLCNKNTKP